MSWSSPPSDPFAAAETLDQLHDAMTAEPAIYSVDVVLDDDVAFLLAGVKVGEDEGGEDAVNAFTTAFDKAIVTAGADTWDVRAAVVAREMAFAG